MSAVATYFVYSFVTSIEDQAKRKFGTEISVLKAKRDIKEMETLNDTMIDVVSIPDTFREPAAIAFVPGDKELSTKSIRSILGSVALVPIKKGEQITFTKITDPGVRTGLAPQISPGRRGYTIPISQVSGVGKLVKPGDRVDLIAIFDIGGSRENRLAKTILQDVLVLATGKNITHNIPRSLEVDSFSGGKEKVRSLAEDTSFSTLTIEVEPAQAQDLALILASGEGNLSVTLRNNDDTERTSIGSSMIFDVIGQQDTGRVQRSISASKSKPQ